LFGRSSEDKVGSSCSTYDEDENCTLGFSGETVGKEPRWKAKRRWDDNIKMDVRNILFSRWTYSVKSDRNVKVKGASTKRNLYLEGIYAPLDNNQALIQNDPMNNS